MTSNLNLEQIELKRKELLTENKKARNLVKQLGPTYENLLLDPLTNFLNYNFLANYTQYLTLNMLKGKLLNQQYNTNKYTTSLLFCDIDGLKLINDTKGHHAGDECITTITSIIKQSIRTKREELLDVLLFSDNFNCNIPIKRGGDEFIIILPNCSKEKANTKVITRIKANIKKQTTNMSLSIGIATTEEIPLPSNLNQNTLNHTFREIVSLAEQRMYEDKNKKLNIKSKAEKQTYLNKKIRRLFTNLGLNINDPNDVLTFYEYLANLFQNSNKTHNKKQ